MISSLKGPIAILGSNSFIGKNLVPYLQRERDDILCATRSNLWEIIDKKPKTIFNLIAYGSSPQQKAVEEIYDTNFTLTRAILNAIDKDAVYLHAGSSAEYGVNSYAIPEHYVSKPNSHYAVTKAACAALINYLGKHEKRPVAHLRLFAVYGPHDKPKKLIPQVIEYGLCGEFPPFVERNLSRDFVYVDDVCRAFVTIAERLTPLNYGDAFNIGTGESITIAEIAQLAARLFAIKQKPQFTIPIREWDCYESQAYTDTTKHVMGFRTIIPFEEGFKRTVEWRRNSGSPK